MSLDTLTTRVCRQDERRPKEAADNVDPLPEKINAIFRYYRIQERKRTLGRGLAETTAYVPLQLPVAEQSETHTRLSLLRRLRRWFGR